MCSAAVVVGLALVLALQVAIHLRLARIPARAASHIRREVRSRARAEADALKEGTAKSVGEIVKSLNQHHDRTQRYQFDLAENYRNEIAALQAHARERAAQANVLADIVTMLCEITDDLRAPRDEEDQRETVEALPRAETSAVLRVPERRPPPVPRAALPPPPPADEAEPIADPDARQTVVSPPPAADDDEPEEELTTVAARSPADLPASSRGRER